jgi:hypothetical protein
VAATSVGFSEAASDRRRTSPTGSTRLQHAAAVDIVQTG